MTVVAAKKRGRPPKYRQPVSDGPLGTDPSFGGLDQGLEGASDDVVESGNQRVPAGITVRTEGSSGGQKLPRKKSTGRKSKSKSKSGDLGRKTLTSDQLNRNIQKHNPRKVKMRAMIKSMKEMRRVTVDNMRLVTGRGSDSDDEGVDGIGNGSGDDGDDGIGIGGIGNRVVEPSKFVDGYSDATLILDVDLRKIGTLLGLSNSIRFAPEKFSKKTRQVFIKFMRLVVENSRVVIHWKKFLLLATVIYGGYNGENSLKAEIDLRLEYLLDDNWYNFTLGNFLKRENLGAAILESDDSKEKRRNVRIDKFVQAGEYSRAMALVCSDGKQVVPSESVFDKLQEKHPARNLDSGISRARQEEMLKYKVSPEEECVVTWSSIRANVKHLHKFVKHGPDKLRNEHLQSLVGSKDEEPPVDELEFCTLLAAIASLVINGQQPEEISAALRDSEMFAGPKGSSDVRPIGIGATLRKICGRECFNLTKSFNEKHFGNVQYALKSGGTEKIIHSFNLAMERDDTDKFAMDAMNAFNSGNRTIGLTEIFTHAKEVFPFMLEMYGKDPNCWYYGLGDAIKPIVSAEGFTQGDVMATWAYIMTIQPFILGLRAILGDGEFVKFLVDDGNICANFETMVEAIGYVLRVGPRYGYIMNRLKGAYLLGKCGKEVALERRQLLVTRFGMDESIIHIHPDDVDEDYKFGTACKYGMVMLGAPVGSNEFVQLTLRAQADNLEAVAECLMNVTTKQSRFLLLKYCFCPKIIHVLRTVRPSLTNELVAKFEDLKKRIFSSILGEHPDYLSDIIWEQCGFAIGDGGMGLSDMYTVQKCAFASSFIAAYHSTLKEEFGLERLLDSENAHVARAGILHVEEFHDIFEEFHRLKPEVFSNIQCFLQVSNDKRETVQSILTKYVVAEKLTLFKEKLTGPLVHRLAWLTSLQGPEVGRWLTVVPRYEDFQFHNVAYEIQMRYRLLLPQRNLAEGTICDCKRKTVLDLFGHHLVSGCGCFGKRTQQHDAMAYNLNGSIGYCGLRSVREELGCFREADPENGKKPDISVINPLPSEDLVPSQGRMPKLILDVQITCPIPGSQGGVFLPMTPYIAKKTLSQAEKAFNGKNTKYKKIAEDNGLSFLPIIFETTGRAHPKALDFIEAMSAHAAEVKRIDKGIVFAFIMNKLSCTLQKCIAETISSRLNTINGHLSRAASRHYSSSSAFVSSHERFRSRGHQKGHG